MNREEYECFSKVLLALVVAAFWFGGPWFGLAVFAVFCVVF